MTTPRALLVAPGSPWAESSGGQQRTALLHRALAELMPVDVLVVREGERDEAAPGDRAEILSRLTWRQPPGTLYKYGVHQWVNGWCQAQLDWSRYQVVVGRYLTPMSKIAWPRHLRTVVDCDDAYYRSPPARETPAARARARLLDWTRFWQSRLAIGRYDHVFFCTRHDQGVFAARSSSVLPNVVRSPAGLPVPCAREDGTALIVGSLWYPPNRQGVDWFIGRCWPAIAARCPTLTLRIVGAAPAAERERWAGVARTEVPGFVEDLAAEYGRALFSIAPVHYGGGTPIKFLEAAAYRRACVATPRVREAFAPEFRHGESMMVARDARAMIEACVDLCRDARLRDAIAGRAHETVARLYTPERFAATVHDGVQRALAQGQRRQAGAAADAR
jgi:hypothetical protein